MNVVHTPYPVAIVGAGPTGLALALGLARHRVRSLLVDRKESTSEYSKAPGIHVRTREAFRLWGVERRILEAGVLQQSVRFYPTDPQRKPLLSLDFSEIADETEDPGLLILEQGRTEALLLEALVESGMCEVRFGAEAVRLETKPGGAKLTITEHGERHAVDARFVVGCDGASSFVREALELPFDGVTYSLQPMLADIKLIDERDARPWPRLENGPEGLSAAIRLERGVWRIIGLEDRRRENPPEDVSSQEVKKLVEKLLGPGRVEVLWASRFRIHQRSSPTFRVGDVLLAGDAAHVHSPAGGQGLNAGVQDAHNLAWKLAYALGGGDVDRLLDSYDEERRAVVVGDVSRYTDLITKTFIDSAPRMRGTAFWALRSLLKSPPLRRRALRRTTMIDLDYPASPLLDAGDRSAGVRLPDPMLRTPERRSVRLYDLLGTGPVLIEVAEKREPLATAVPVEKVIRIAPGHYHDPSGLLRKLLGRRDGWILVRPDAHVAWARETTEGMEAAVSRALGGPVEPE